MFINEVVVHENEYDPRLCCDGGSYYQPYTEIHFSDGSVMEIDDTSCGDFGSRIDVSYGGKHAHYGSMLSEHESWSDFDESDVAMLDMVYSHTGYFIPVGSEI